MNDEVIYLNDFSNTKETVSKRPIKCMSVFIYILFCMILVFFIWSSFMKLDITVSATGETSTSATPLLFSSPCQGFVSNLNVVSGTKVSKGNLLLSVRTVINDTVENIPVYSEADGMVLFQSGTKPGTVFNKGDLLYRIVPENGVPTVNISFPENFYEDIEINMPVKVSIPAFKSWGTLSGSISSIANIPFTNENGSNYFNAIVELDNFDGMIFSDNGKPFLTGLKADAVILTDQVTVLHWILSFLHFAK